MKFAAKMSMKRLAELPATVQVYLHFLPWEMQHKMEQRTLKIVNNCLNTNIYSYLETFGGQSYNLYLNVVNCCSPDFLIFWFFLFLF